MVKPITDKLPSIVRLGTRTSQLALWQTNHVVEQLQHHWPGLQCELIHLVTQGDKRLDRPLPEIGGKGLFTAELEDALRQGKIDLAVHSLKDLPVEDAHDLIIGAILRREDPRDVLVARERWTLATLPIAAIVGTSSLRRQAQLLAARPDLDVRSIRGNVDTRLRKVLSGEYHAAVMAGAGLSRLGLTEHITEWLEPNTMISAPGQGALAVQCRANDPAVHALLAPLDDAEARATTLAERYLLLRLGGGCSAPIGAWARIEGDSIDLRARIATVDGRQVFDAHALGSDPDAVARKVADELLSQGARVALSRDLPSPRPLGGKRVVITRPRQDYGEGNGTDLVTQLQNVGAVPIVIPAIQLQVTEDRTPLHEAISRLSMYDWIIFTSANAVEYFLALAESDQIQAALNGTKIVAVGPATLEALTSRGLSVAAMPQEYLGANIFGVLGDIRGKRLLLPRSAKGSPDLPNALSEHGAVVDEIALYTPIPAPIGEAELALLSAGIDVVTFASGSAVRAFVNTLRADARFDSFWSDVVVACIGPTTAEAARSEGLPVQIVATEHSAQGLVAAIVNFYEQGA